MCTSVFKLQVLFKGALSESEVQNFGFRRSKMAEGLKLKSFLDTIISVSEGDLYESEVKNSSFSICLTKRT